MQDRLKLVYLFIFSFILSLHYAVVIYAESTYLTQVFGGENIWIIYSLSAFFTILFSFSLTKVLKKIEISKLSKNLLIFAFLNVLLIPFYSHTSIIAISFTIFTVLAEILFLLSSIMLEHYSKDIVTGSIRGNFLTMESLGYVLAPSISAFFINIFGITSIFSVSAFFILCAFLFFAFTTTPYEKITNKKANLKSAFKKLYSNSDVRNILVSQIGLSFFYATVILYIPFKLEASGIQLTKYLSIILPIALTPFLFIPPFLGHLEDNFKDEKPILLLSYFGLIFFLIFISFFDSSSIFIWSIVLFLGRCFASMADTSISSYLFKHIDDSDTGVIALYTSSQNIAYLIATPIFGLIFIKYFDLKTLFLFVSLLLCFMLIFVVSLRKNYIYENKKEDRLRQKVISEKSEKRTQKSLI